MKCRTDTSLIKWQMNCVSFLLFMKGDTNLVNAYMSTLPLMSEI